MTFGAACAAVFWAKRAYDIEVIPRLGQSRCTDHEAINHPVDKEIFITQELQYLEDLPAGLNRQHIAEQFDRQVHSMFMNLGRTALANVQVAMHVEKVGVTGRLFPVRFRNLKVDRDIHVVVYISRKYSDAVVTWDAATSSGRPIEFTPEDAFDEKLEVFELRFS